MPSKNARVVAFATKHERDCQSAAMVYVDPPNSAVALRCTACGAQLAFTFSTAASLKAFVQTLLDAGQTVH